MGKPSFQFYPDDWLTDIGLRGCSPGARGVWADLLCMMHQGVPYGHLSDAAGTIPVKLVASRCGIPTRLFGKLLAELELHKVFSRDDLGIIFSRRMVRDERVRIARAQGGSTSFKNPAVPRTKDILNGILHSHPPKDTFDPEEGEEVVNITQKKSSSMRARGTAYDPMPGWTKFKLSYPPHRINELMDLQLWISVIDSVVLESRAIAGLLAHRDSDTWTKENGKYVPQASRFLSERIFDIPAQAKTPQKPRLMF